MAGELLRFANVQQQQKNNRYWLSKSFKWIYNHDINEIERAMPSCCKIKISFFAEPIEQIVACSYELALDGERG